MSIYNLQSYSELAVFLFSESFRENGTNRKIANKYLVTQLDTMIIEKINNEKSKIKNLFRSTFQQFQKIRNLFEPSKAKRRGLFNFWGEFESKIFGVATEADIRKLESKIENSQEISKKVIKINDKLISIVHLLSLIHI